MSCGLATAKCNTVSQKNGASIIRNNQINKENTISLAVDMFIDEGIIPNSFYKEVYRAWKESEDDNSTGEIWNAHMSGEGRLLLIRGHDGFVFPHMLKQYFSGSNVDFQLLQNRLKRKFAKLYNNKVISTSSEKTQDSSSFINDDRFACIDTDGDKFFTHGSNVSVFFKNGKIYKRINQKNKGKVIHEINSGIDDNEGYSPSDYLLDGTFLEDMPQGYAFEYEMTQPRGWTPISDDTNVTVFEQEYFMDKAKKILKDNGITIKIRERTELKTKGEYSITYSKDGKDIHAFLITEKNKKRLDLRIYERSMIEYHLDQRYKKV